MIRKAAEAIVRPLKRDGIEELYIEGPEGRSERIIKSEAIYFDAVFSDGQTLHEHEHEARYEIVRLSFNPEHKWGFTDGAVKFRASIDDPDFWLEVRAGLRFAKGDHVVVRFRVRTYRNDAGDLKSEYSITKVLRHIPRHDLGQFDLPH